MDFEIGPNFKIGECKFKGNCVKRNSNSNSKIKKLELKR